MRIGFDTGGLPAASATVPFYQTIVTQRLAVREGIRIRRDAGGSKGFAMEEGEREADVLGGKSSAMSPRSRGEVIAATLPP